MADDSVVPATPPNDTHEEEPTARPMLHIIGDDLVLSDQIQSHMQQWGLENVGLNYNMVAVFGSQSTGKSTLLNLLFHTHFAVMNTDRRQQTTKGLWMGMGSIPNLLVVDVEGTDGRERGENQEMERKSALFSLATAQVLIVNLFEHDVGRYNGANYGLLKTVFEVNLDIFQAARPQKTLLLFVIRDHAGTPLENLAETLKTDMNTIWNDLKKPQGHENAQMSTYFDMRFVGLAHKVFQTDKFVSQVDNLRKWFVDSNSPDYVFQSQYHRGIPADGWYKFAEAIWDKIITNRDLDLPTQRQLLAQYRCAEISKAASETLFAEAKNALPRVEGGRIIEKLGSQMNEWKKSALDAYDAQASRYDNEVYLRIREELISQIHVAFHVLFTGQLRNLQRVALKTFADKMVELETTNKNNFVANAEQARHACLDFYRTAARELLLEGADWSVEDTIEQLENDIKQEIEKRRANELNEIIQSVKEMIKINLSEQLIAKLDEAPATLWTDVSEIIDMQLQSALGSFKLKIKGFEATEKEIQTYHAAIRKELAQVALKILEDEASETKMTARLKKRFERSFKFDESKRPRVWSATSPINAIFDESRQKVESVLQLFKISQTEALGKLSEDVPDLIPRPLVGERAYAAILEQFEQDANVMFQDAQRSITQQNTHIPTWIYPLLLFLGYNELVDIIFSPGKYIMLAMLALIIYAIITSFGLTDTVKEAISTAYEKVMQLVTDSAKSAIRQGTVAALQKAGSSTMGSKAKSD